jgi:hypothetical protein
MPDDVGTFQPRLSVQLRVSGSAGYASPNRSCLDVARLWPSLAATARLRPLGFGGASFLRYRVRRMVGTTGIEPVTPTMSR